ncbi:MAG TPA: oligosaccharide flippase family protein [Chthoniobacterales bacterium]
MSSTIRRWARFILGRGAPRDFRERRSRGVFQGTASGVVWRLVAIAVSIVSVPLTIGYLGTERYGAWVTISTVLTFLGITDFGLGASLTNALGHAQAKDAREIGRRYVSSTLVTLCLIALAIIVIASAFAPTIAAFLFPHLQSPQARAEIVPAVWLALSIFALNLPLVIVARVLAAHQKSAIANLWNIAGTLGNLIALLIVIWSRGGLPWLVAGCFGFGLLANITSAIWLFGFHKPWLRPHLRAVDPTFIKVLFSDGWKFFIISIGWMINWQTDNIVIAHFLGASYVTPYAVTFSLFGMASGLQMLAYPALWPAYTEAFAQHDYDWIRQTLRSNFKFSFFTSLAIAAVLVIFAKDIIRLWAGAAAVPPFAVIVWMALWRLMISTMLVGSCVLNATGHLKGMTIYGTVTAFLNLILSILFAKLYGITGVAAATAIAYAVSSYVPTFVEVRSVVRKFPMTKREEPRPAMPVAV